MRIKQFACLPEFKERISKKYRLNWYSQIDKPAIFFGLFQQEHIDAVVQHKTLVVVVWIGTDSYYLQYSKSLDYSGIFNVPHIRHIATSRWIADDLSRCGIPHLYFPINYVPVEKFQSVKLGSKIYCYSPPDRPVLYGRAITDEVKKRLPDIEFVTTTDYYDYPIEQMPKLYSECFVGLRPTIHDGVSESVVEMGLMGRRYIHNGLAPNAIHWETPEDIVNSIRNEQKKIGDIDNRLAEKVAEYAYAGDDWLYTEFYKGVK